MVLCRRGRQRTMKRICDTRWQCGVGGCIHAGEHTCFKADAETGRHDCGHVEALVRCTPVEEKVRCERGESCETKADCEFALPHEPARVECEAVHWCPRGDMTVQCIPVSKLCPSCGADLAAWLEVLGEEHRCFADRPVYRCTRAADCPEPECNAAEDHTHVEAALHGPRKCYFLNEHVDCEPLTAQSVAEAIMRDRWPEFNRVEVRMSPHPITLLKDVPDTMTRAVWESSVWHILVESFCHPLAETRGIREARLREDITDAAARIMNLPPVRHED